jgi:hypothetical protein
MDVEAITGYVTTSLPGVEVLVASKEGGAPEIAWGDSFFIYDPTGSAVESRRLPFATIVNRDYGEFDNASNLDREGVFRLNVGVDRETFNQLFGDGGEHDFTALDLLMPHPVYGRNHWVCVLNPSVATFETVKPLLANAHAQAQQRFGRRRG